MRGRDVLAELRAWRDEFARSHGYDLRAMVAVLREMDAAAGARVDPAYTSITEWQYTASTWQLARLNDVAHLQNQ